MEPAKTGASSTRRQVVLGGLGLAAWPAALRGADEDALDAALQLLHGAEPVSKQGLSTHAPMVAEALTALDRADGAVAWVRNYRAREIQLPGRVQPIAAAEWRSVLGPDKGASTWEGQNVRWADWHEFFARELGAAPWRTVLDTWAGRLAPGMSGAATHGVIRTAHAARALGRRENAIRRGELARGLAYWASSYEELPAGTPFRPAASFAAALAEVPLYTEAFGQSPQGRNIVEVLRHLEKLDRFRGVKGLIGDPQDPAAALSALTATFARVFLRHGTKHHTIAFVHAVTGPATLRRLAPYLRPETARAAFPYAWQAAAGLYAAYARKGDGAGPEETKLTPAELIENAVRRGDEHGIKFTEVMLAEHRVNPDPVYLAAADAALKVL